MWILWQFIYCTTQFEEAHSDSSWRPQTLKFGIRIQTYISDPYISLPPSEFLLISKNSNMKYLRRERKKYVLTNISSTGWLILFTFTKAIFSQTNFVQSMILALSQTPQYSRLHRWENGFRRHYWKIRGFCKVAP